MAAASSSHQLPASPKLRRDLAFSQRGVLEFRPYHPGSKALVNTTWLPFRSAVLGVPCGDLLLSELEANLVHVVERVDVLVLRDLAFALVDSVVPRET